MCSTPRSFSSPRRQSIGYHAAFPVNHGYWNKMVAEKDKQLAERARLKELEALYADDPNETGRELMEAEVVDEVDHSSALSRLFSWLMKS